MLHSGRDELTRLCVTEKVKRGRAQMLQTINSCCYDGVSLLFCSLVRLLPLNSLFMHFIIIVIFGG